MRLIFSAIGIWVASGAVALGAATVSPQAAYLPDDMESMRPELEAAIDLVAAQHPGCTRIDNASFSETHATSNEPAFFVSCEMAPGLPPFQNVYVRGGQIVATKP